MVLSTPQDEDPTAYVCFTKGWRRSDGGWRRRGQMVAVLVKQEAREAGEMLTMFAEAWGSSRWYWLVKGRT